MSIIKNFDRLVREGFPSDILYKLAEDENLQQTVDQLIKELSDRIDVFLQAAFRISQINQEEAQPFVASAYNLNAYWEDLINELRERISDQKLSPRIISSLQAIHNELANIYKNYANVSQQTYQIIDMPFVNLNNLFVYQVVPTIEQYFKPNLVQSTYNNWIIEQGVNANGVEQFFINKSTNPNNADKFTQKDSIVFNTLEQAQTFVDKANAGELPEETTSYPQMEKLKQELEEIAKSVIYEHIQQTIRQNRSNKQFDIRKHANTIKRNLIQILKQEFQGFFGHSKTFYDLSDFDKVMIPNYLEDWSAEFIEKYFGPYVDQVL